MLDGIVLLVHFLNQQELLIKQRIGNFMYPFHKTTTQERMQQYFNNFRVKYSGRSQLEGEPRSVSVLSQRSVPSPNIFSTGQNSFTGTLPQPTRAPKQRIGNFVYPTRKVMQQPDEVDPNSIDIVSNNDENGAEQTRQVSAFSWKICAQVEQTLYCL